MTLLDRVLRTVRMHRMIPAGGRVLVAVSGGSDSVALALLVRELERLGLCRLTGVAHLNHGLRAAAADDEELCRKLASELGVPFHVERLAMREIARARRRSIEDAARTERYRFFNQLLDATGADVAATGHTRDDQAETVLLRLLRGSGTRGLSAILPVAGRVVRPLIDVRRDDLRRYLTERGQPFAEDETNSNLAIPRNRVRHLLIPFLRREFAAGITDVLAREAAMARADDDYLRHRAIDSGVSIVLRNNSGSTVAPTRDELEVLARHPEAACLDGPVAAVEIDADALAALHPALGSRLARLILSILAPDRFVGYDHVDVLLSLAAASSGAASLPGQQAIRRGHVIELVREPFRAFANSFSVPLSIPGEVTLATQGWAVSAAAEPHLDTARHAGADFETRMAVAVQAAPLALPLAVRSRRPGDRFRPPGMGGRSKKLQDFLVDRKIARRERDHLPLVVDSRDRIVWIVGQAPAEDFQVTEGSQGVILLKARRLGGQG